MDIVLGCNIRPRIEVQQGDAQGILRAPLVTGLWDLWDYNRVSLTQMSYSTFQATHTLNNMNLRASLWHWFLTQWKPSHQKRWVSTCLTPEIQYQVSMERLESRVAIAQMSSNIYNTWNPSKKLQWSQNDPVCLPFLSTQVCSFPSKCRFCYSISWSESLDQVSHKSPTPFREAASQPSEMSNSEFVRYSQYSNVDFPWSNDECSEVTQTIFNDLLYPGCTPAVSKCWVVPSLFLTAFLRH